MIMFSDAAGRAFPRERCPPSPTPMGLDFAQRDKLFRRQYCARGGIMDTQDNATKVADLDQLLDFRDKTERISALLTKRLKDHLGTLSPVLEPKLVFGKYIGARDSALLADEAFGQLKRKYNEVCGPPFNFRGDLPEDALSSSDGGIEIYPWEYTHEAHGLKTTKNISMTCPVRWVVT
jgi:hypothetical protein